MNTIEYRRMFEAEESQWWYAGMRAIAFGLIDAAHAGRPGSNRRFLDAGCGSGRNLLELERRGSGIGVDLSPEALRFCRERGVAVVRGELGRLPFASASFDGVTSFDVIYHRWVEDDAAAVHEMARLLRPGGLLLIRVPALAALRGAHDEAVLTRHRYTLGELRALLEGAGLELLRASYCNTLLLPLLALRRGLDRLTGRHGSDVSFLPAPLEWLFRGLLGLEAAWLQRGHSLPLGASALALGRRAR
jgi:SAM-dependent methyltransferase